MVKVSLIILIGIPGSGKTSFCNQLFDKISKQNVSNENKFAQFNYVHVCYDSIISLEEQMQYSLLAAAESYEGLWKKARDSVYQNVESLLEYVLVSQMNLDHLVNKLEEYKFRYIPSNSGNDNLVILLDDNFYYRSMRHQFYSLAYKFKIGFGQVYFDCSVPLALENNSKREFANQIPSRVILNIAEKLQKPSQQFNWESNSINFDTSHLSIDSKFEILLNRFQDLVSKSMLYPADTHERELERKCKEAISSCSKIICSKSVLHQSDLVLRGFVSNIMKDHVDDKKTAGKNANGSRQFVLSQIKEGNLVLPEQFSEDYCHNMEPILRDYLYKYFILKFEELNKL